MFEKIPQDRLRLYISLLAIIPFIFVWINFSSNLAVLKNLEQRLELISINALKKESEQSGNLAVQAEFKDSDRYYIEKHLENISFLRKEAQILEKTINNKNFSGDPTITRRLEFLNSTDNRLTFSESQPKSTVNFKESKLTLSHPVEVDIDDIKKILTTIEGTKIGSQSYPTGAPQLIITDFRLDRKDLSDKNQVYILNMKLLKREFQ